MHDLHWSPAEKKMAHAAFEAAVTRELAAIRREIEAMLQGSSDPGEIWEIHDYLSDKRREFDRKYDFRYSVLISVFARLLAEGWLTTTDLTGLGPEKLQLIRHHSAVWTRIDA